MKIKNIIFLLVGLSLLLIVSFQVSRNSLTEAERVLKVEETIAVARNRQIFAERQAIEDFETERRKAAEEREFNRSVYGTSEPPPEVVQQRIERHLRKLALEKE